MLKSAQMESSFADITPYIGGTITIEQWQRQREQERLVETQSETARSEALSIKPPTSRETRLSTREVSFAGAACRDEDKEVLFFEPINIVEEESKRNRREAAAKAICKMCDFKKQCLEIALSDRRAIGGIWGETNEKDRRHLRRAVK